MLGFAKEMKGNRAMFRNREDGGRQLARRLEKYKGRSGTLVLALPRGGVVTGFEVARFLNAPFDVLIVRKIGFPGQPELAIGAVSETGTVVLNQDIFSMCNIPEAYIRTEVSREEKVIAHRIERYRGGKKLGGLEGKIIILVDDGVATGATMKAAIATLQKEKIEKLVVAVPVAPPATAEELKRMVDEFICLSVPPFFTAVGSFYDDFSQVTDEEVVDIMQKTTVGYGAAGA